MKGELMPSTVSDIGIRPRWIAKNTAASVSIHVKSEASTVRAPLFASARRRAKVSLGGRPSLASG
jgi:hypothetical protein